ncbi:hypothetical protein PV729_45060 [Streptomyces europaeiscabiei]|uniref:Small CPxCG-related zinc finger protein n=1 Tax=Streptomyces europaeiscabiei TaxID=146819 RepID=A0ABU4NWD2_9ACTN|nr:hypothetical protein [Streptomyces europaeiscabiei]MDX2759156.1 hypothetical protein [Streptomyces europaeiscabiei]MDX2767053.1 hypothetical protein [Streptomyces europaeiscabiei]MDX3549782.1 hypothetical protein [Streptomyces europaeiscabiei]MDX3558744.1 hypothetical protein [Streptomyces europaeiscabiei]MDX3707123.1 hypothetical protein [Streptomyces europaeiscabiei]
MTTLPSPPPTSELTYGQYQGWNCCWCGVRLTTGAVEAGVSRGGVGAHVHDNRVYACPDCAARVGLTETTSTGDAS